MLMPALEKSAIKSTRGQAYLDQAVIGCALEKYHIEHGAFPETLEGLAPKYLEAMPADLFDGKPLRYRRESDGGYLLYSIGWNQKDDGGVIISGKDAKEKGSETQQGDWVWKMPGALNN
jgi:hypothetical protein